MKRRFENSGSSVATAEQMLKLGMVQAAHEMASRLLAERGNQPSLLLVLAEAEEKLGDTDAGLRHIGKYLQLVPESLPAMLLSAGMLHRSGRSREAIAVCDRALDMRPGEPAFILLKATAQDQMNDQPAAWQALEPMLASDNAPMEAAGLATRILAGLQRHEESLDWARRATAHPQATPASQRTVLLHMAKVLDRIGRYDDAFDASVKAHELSRRPFNVDEFRSYVDSLITTFSSKSLGRLARGRDRSALPVFIIGMPRSGTTLVEQMIASHPQAFAAGEIDDIIKMARSMTTETDSMHVYPDCLSDVTPAIASRLSGQYLAHLREVAGGTAERVSNKMLQQYEHVGLIWMLFPGAQIVHVKRDPLDTCLSCFTTHLNADRMPYVSSLENLGSVYRQHERLMQHWQSVLDLPFLTVQYETLVADQVAETRRIIDFIGLPWNDRCLRYWENDRTVMTLSYDQVNKPIYDSSIGRWKNYEKHLGPLKAALGLR